MSANKVVNLAGKFQINGQDVDGMKVDTSVGTVRYNEAFGLVAVVGFGTDGKLVKGVTTAEDAIMQQLTTLGSRGTRDAKVRVPEAFA